MIVEIEISDEDCTALNIGAPEELIAEIMEAWYLYMSEVKPAHKVIPCKGCGVDTNSWSADHAPNCTQLPF